MVNQTNTGTYIVLLCVWGGGGEQCVMFDPCCTQVFLVGAFHGVSVVLNKHVVGG